MKKIFSKKKPVMTEQERFRQIALEQTREEMRLKKEEEKRRKKMKQKRKSPKIAIEPPSSMQSSSVEPIRFEEAHSTQLIARPEVMKRLNIQTPKIDYGAEEKKQAKKNAELFSMKNIKQGQRRYFGGVKPSSVGISDIDVELGFKD